MSRADAMLVETRRTRREEPDRLQTTGPSVDLRKLPNRKCHELLRLEPEVDLASGGTSLPTIMEVDNPSW